MYDAFYDTNVIASLNFEGDDGSTSITDHKDNKWTVGGGAHITSSVHGPNSSACLILNGSTDYIYSDYGAKWALGSNDFCLDAWVYMTASRNTAGHYGGIISMDNITGTTRGWILVVSGDAGGKLQFAARSGSTSYVVSSTAALPIEQWIHVEIDRQGSTLYLFVMGVLQATTTIGTAAINDLAEPVQIGSLYASNADNSNNRFPGYVQSVRWTMGAARHTASFTPPLSPLNTYSIPGVTAIDGVAASRKIAVFDYATGRFLVGGVSSSADGTFTLRAVGSGGAVICVAFDDYGQYWRPGIAYSAGAATFPTSPNGHWYQTGGGGTSGTPEPSWPTDGSTVTDGTAIWTDMGTMRAPVIQGPFIPVAA